MICIFSGKKDFTTTQVIKWINNLSEYEVIRINYDETPSSQLITFEVINNDFTLKIDDRVVRLNEIKSVWYRKGKNWLLNFQERIKIKDHFNFSEYLNDKISSEQYKLSEYLHYLITSQIPCLGNPTKNDLNKLIVLEMAKQVGFLVPSFYISNISSQLKKILHESKDMVTKAMSDGIYFFDHKQTEYGYFSYTETIQVHELEKLREIIGPSFIQKNIRKAFDLRVFFLVDRCFSIAIISQTDQKTKIDFRKYNDQKPNRNVPYLISNELEAKICQLFRKLQLNTGSIDFVVDIDNNFYFLEINPVGQFTNFSISCNFNLEKEIAKTLITYANNKSDFEFCN